MGNTLLAARAEDMIDNIAHTRAYVNNYSTQVLSKNPNRRFMRFVNDSNELMYLSFGVPAELHRGVRLEANGGWLEFSLCVTNLCECAIYAIQEKPIQKLMLVTEGT